MICWRTVSWQGGRNERREREIGDCSTDAFLCRFLDFSDGLQERLRGIKHVIFDEADTLLEGGFLRDIMKILGRESRSSSSLSISSASSSSTSGDQFAADLRPNVFIVYLPSQDFLIDPASLDRRFVSRFVSSSSTRLSVLLFSFLSSANPFARR